MTKNTSDPVTALRTTLEPHLARIDVFSETGHERVFDTLIDAARSISDRLEDNKPYLFDDGGDTRPYGQSVSALNALFSGYGEWGEVPMSFAKPYEKPNWMDARGYDESIIKSYDDTLAVLIRERLNGKFMAEYPRYRFVRAALDMTFERRICRAFDGSRLLPHVVAEQVEENVLETLAYGLTLVLGKSPRERLMQSESLAKLAETFTCVIPVGKTPTNVAVYRRMLVLVA